MKKILALSIIILFILCSCGTNYNSNININEQVKTLPGDETYNILEEYKEKFSEKKVSTEGVSINKSDIDEFCEFYSERVITSSHLITTTIDDIKEMYGLDYLRKTKDVVTGSDFVYSIHPVKDDNNSILYMVITYNMNGYVIDSFCNDKIPSNSEFLSVEAGKSTYETVLSIDKNAHYEFDENYMTSYHKCSGFDVTICYEKKGKSYIVSDIKTSVDEVRIVYNLSDIDKEMFFN